MLREETEDAGLEEFEAEDKFRMPAATVALTDELMGLELDEVGGFCRGISPPLSAKVFLFAFGSGTRVR